VLFSLLSLWFPSTARIGALLGSCMTFLQGQHVAVSHGPRAPVFSNSFLHLVSCVDILFEFLAAAVCRQYEGMNPADVISDLLAFLAS